MAYQNGPKIVTNGLVLCLDAGSPKSYPGSGTSWVDLSGNGNNGTLTNGPTFNSANGGSIVFDGSNDYASTPFSFTNRLFSINCWLYFNSLNGWQTFVGQDSTLPVGGLIYFQKTHNSLSIAPRLNNSFNFVINFTDDTSDYCADPVSVTTGVWYNYCVSVTATNFSLYKNGVLVAVTNNNKSIAGASGSVIIGAGYYNSAIVDYANGRLTQVSIYNRPLSAAEILQNYNATKGRFKL